LLAKRFHWNAIADHLIALVKLGAEATIFLLEAKVLDSVFYNEADFFEREGFLEKFKRSEFCSLHSGFDRAVPGNHDDHRARVGFLKLAKYFQSVHSGTKPNVEQHDVGGLAREMFDALFAGRDSVNLIAIFAERSGERFANAGFIVNDQDCRGHGE
jgi:hypothetical protein